MNITNLLLKIYGRLPVFLQNLAISLVGCKLYFERYTGKYHKYFEFYNSRTHKNQHSEKVIQNKLFLKLLHYAYENSPFYKEFYKDIDINSIKSVDDIEKLPILTKDLLKENIETFYTINRRKGLRFYTGGTTGNPIMVLKRREDVQKRMAYLDAYKAQFGFINNKMKSARFFGKNIIAYPPRNHIFWRNNYISKQRFYSTYYLQEENLHYYVEDLNKFKPKAIDGFPSAIYTVAKYILENDIKLDFTPLAVFTTSETLLPMYRQTIEKAFRCRVVDQYASNEGAPFIIQCKYGSYHEAIDTGVFEHIPTEQGIKLLVTGFDTFGTPLIRYDIGDMIDTSNQKNCPCGLYHPIIGGVLGRNSSYLITKSRGHISQSQLGSIVATFPREILEMQFVQEDKDKIIVNIVLKDEEEGKQKKAKYTYKKPNKRKEIHKHIKMEEYIIDTLKSYLGEDMKLQICYLNQIPRSNSGKFQPIINQMEDINDV